MPDISPAARIHRLARPPVVRAMTSALILLAIVLVSAGCVYRIDIQQGNFLEAKDIDRVNVGMTRLQVRALLGTPMVADPFESSRWDYVYYFKHGRLRDAEYRHFIVFFDGDKVTRVDRPTDRVEASPTRT